MADKATAFAPASVGNVGVGFDVLGHAMEGPGDRATVTRVSRLGVVIAEAPAQLPTEPERNSAGRGLLILSNTLGLDFGFEVRLEKGIPISAGMGGSSASAVASLVAANALLEQPLPGRELLRYALEGEYAASETHTADNVAPILFGGLVLVSPDFPPVVTSVPVPKDLRCVVVHPAIEVDTRTARATLDPMCKLSDAVHQSARLAQFVAGCFENDPELIRGSFEDVLVEPQRERLVPGFFDVKEAAVRAGALGCSLSGGGPSVFAWSPAIRATAVAQAMQAVFDELGVDSESWTTRIDAPGARLES